MLLLNSDFTVSFTVSEMVQTVFFYFKVVSLIEENTDLLLLEFMQ